MATAPVRTADVGGWTDTWFASHGSVCNVAIEPGVTVTLESSSGPAGTVHLRVLPVGPTVTVTGGASADPRADPLLVAAVRTRSLDHAVTITIESGVPAGSGLGTSAAVTVALLAALDAASRCPRSRHELACAAHRVETGLGLQSGLQDQLASAHGGVNRFDVDYPYGGTVHPIGDARLLARLDERLVTVYLGRPHASSALHELVIAALEVGDNDALLSPLRRAAHDAAAALTDGDLSSFGRAMTHATEGMHRLHPDLIGPTATRVIEIAHAAGASGWKVNGAGGDGGSVAVLAPEDPIRRAAFVAAVNAEPDLVVLQTRVARRGVEVSEQ